MHCVCTYYNFSAWVRKEELFTLPFNNTLNITSPAENYTMYERLPGWAFASMARKDKCEPICQEFFNKTEPDNAPGGNGTNSSFGNNSNANTGPVEDVVYGPVNGSHSKLDISGSQRTGLRAAPAAFYTGAEIRLRRRNLMVGPVWPAMDSRSNTACTWAGGCQQMAIIEEYDNVTQVATFEWKLPGDAPPTGASVIEPGVGDAIMIVYTDEMVRNQAHRCVIKIADSFGNLIDDMALSVGVSLKDEGAPPLFGPSSSLTLGGLATFGGLSVEKSGTYSMLFQVADVLDSDNLNGSQILGVEVGLTVVNGPRTSLELVATPEPAFRYGIEFPTQPVVKIVDAFGNPVVDSSCTGVTAVLRVSLPNWGLYLYNANATYPNGTEIENQTCTMVPGVVTFPPNSTWNESLHYNITDIDGSVVAVLNQID